ncbi:nucleotidyl transferase AbiEii/AbiGii toxin family protein [Nocardia alni]|uniref:nucleotidyl transferase AbiEii/AbiGii toxin family protein n=1 Tax=Nocardia alni TaxID=2815723 RepID=UPI001C21C07E|nr:nucleotidyl transferase AbiEii/AbiGii toxin family protein [Nocardia alni]
MLSAADEHLIVSRFGVARAQVRRDHLISHVLAAIAKRLPDQVLFFGGTALSRTLIPEGRLSEDIDLIALTDRRSTAEALHRAVVSELRREYPGLAWQPALTVRQAWLGTSN